MSQAPFLPEVEERFVAAETVGNAGAAAAAAAQADADLAQGGVFDVALAANTETSTGTSGALSISKLESLIDSTAGAGSRTLAAPAAGAVRLKIIRMSVDNGDTTLAATNIDGSAGSTFTFDSVGDQIILMASGQKWVYLGGSINSA